MDDLNASGIAKPAWPVILQTTLSGAAQGLFLIIFLLALSRSPPGGFLLLACEISLLLAAGGLIASFFRPGRAVRAAAQWRASWPAREAIVLPAFTATVLLYGLSLFFGLDRDISLGFGAVAAALSMALYVCTGMVHSSPKSPPERHSPLTLANFALLGTASGALLAVPLAVIAYPQFAGPLALAAFGLAGAAWLARGATLLRHARLRPTSAPADLATRAVRWTFLVLLFPLPGWLLGWGGGSLASFIAAFALHFAGLLAERWYFFAEARRSRQPNSRSAA